MGAECSSFHLPRPPARITEVITNTNVEPLEREVPASASFKRAATGLLLIKVGVATVPVAVLMAVCAKLASGLLVVPFVLVLLLLVPVLLVGTVGGELLCLLAPTRVRGRMWLAAAILLQLAGMGVLVTGALGGDREDVRSLGGVATVALFAYLAALAREIGSDAGRCIRASAAWSLVAAGGIIAARALGPQSSAFFAVLGLALGCVMMALRSYWAALTELRADILHRDAAALR